MMKKLVSSVVVVVAVATTAPACATLNDVTIAAPTRERATTLAGSTLHCAGVAHERAFWSNIGAGGALVASQVVLGVVGPVAAGCASTGGNGSCVAIVVVGGLGSLGLLGGAAGLSIYSAYEQIQGAWYEQAAGDIAAHSDAGSDVKACVAGPMPADAPTQAAPPPSPSPRDAAPTTPPASTPSDAASP